MENIDTRQVSRDSLFLLAKVRAPDAGEEHSVKVRNLSAGGLMAEGSFKVSRGELVEIELRNLGWVEGRVAWVQGDRFGISFDQGIDPRVARQSGPKENGNGDGLIVRRRPASNFTPIGKLRTI